MCQIVQNQSTFFLNLTKIRSVNFFSIIIWYSRFGLNIFFSMCPIFVRSILANLSIVHYFLFIGSMRWNKRTVILRDEVKRLAKECKMRLYRTSVKEDLNVSGVFQHLAENYVNKVKSFTDSNNSGYGMGFQVFKIGIQN